MSAIAFVLLAHENASHVADLISTLTDADPGCHVVVHYDAKAPTGDYNDLRAAFDANGQVLFVEDRVRCGWGEFGLVEGSLRALALLKARQVDYSHAYLLSGSCLPVRPLGELRAFLDRHATTEFIESFTKKWIVGGLKDERFQYWFPFNFQKHQRLFEISTRLQRRLRIRRKFPKSLEPRFGSQWWCLTRGTCESILQWIEAHPRDYRFFHSTWIPDECFFQTLVAKLVSAERIFTSSLTFYRFNSNGKPLVYYDDHGGFLTSLPYFFARKISPRAQGLRQTLRALAKAAPGRLPDVPREAPEELSVTRLIPDPAFYGRPGQIFHSDQAARTWPGALRRSARGFAVLFGPSMATRAAADALRQSPGLTVLGRLFRQGEIDFGPALPGLGVLGPEDVAIRDMDPTLYLARVLERCPGFPVFELSPEDDCELARTAVLYDGAILIPVMPVSHRPHYANLFWLLGQSDTGSAAQFARSKLDGRTEPGLLSRAARLSINRAFGAKHVEFLNEQLFGAEPYPCSLFFGPGARAALPSPDLARGIVHRQGEPVRALLEALPAATEALRPFDGPATLGHLDPYWRAFFAPLLENPEPSPRAVVTKLLNA